MIRNSSANHFRFLAAIFQILDVDHCPPQSPLPPLLPTPPLTLPLLLLLFKDKHHDNYNNGNNDNHWQLLAFALRITAKFGVLSARLMLARGP